MPNANSVWGAYLRYRGYERHFLPDDCPDCYSVENFCTDHQKGELSAGALDTVHKLTDTVKKHL